MWTWPARWSTSRSSRSCSKPAPPCWRRRTSPALGCLRSSARAGHRSGGREGAPVPGPYIHLRGIRAPRGTDHSVAGGLRTARFVLVSALLLRECLFVQRGFGSPPRDSIVTLGDKELPVKGPRGNVIKEDERWPF